jgi:hypothetical protein
MSISHKPLFPLPHPHTHKDEIEQDKTGNKRQFEVGHMNGAPYKLDNISNFHVGEVVTCVKKTSLVPGGSEVLVYTTILGVCFEFLKKEKRKREREKEGKREREKERKREREKERKRERA